jgi:hypothetical protein
MCCCEHSVSIKSGVVCWAQWVISRFAYTHNDSPQKYTSRLSGCQEILRRRGGPLINPAIADQGKDYLITYGKVIILRPGTAIVLGLHALFMALIASTLAPRLHPVPVRQRDQSYTSLTTGGGIFCNIYEATTG